MKIGTNGLKLIKFFEGCKLEAYLDVARIPTIGFGHTHNVEIGDRITQAQADSFLASDLSYHESNVNTMVKVAISNNQFDALVSFCYNEGPGKLKGSHLLKYLNSGSLLAAANEFSKWIYAAGKRDAGLIKRRACEKVLFLTSDDEEFTLGKMEKF